MSLNNCSYQDGEFNQSTNDLFGKNFYYSEIDKLERIALWTQPQKPYPQSYYRLKTEYTGINSKYQSLLTILYLH